MALQKLDQSIPRIFLRSAHNYDKDKVSRETGLVCDDPSRTDQSALKESDINELVRRFKVTGQMPQGIRMPTYGDYEGIFDYHTAQQVLVDAKDSFMQLRADIRDEFNNDPAEFLKFCADEKNRKQLEEWGMAIPKPQEQVTPENKPEDKKSS